MVSLPEKTTIVRGWHRRGVSVVVAVEGTQERLSRLLGPGEVFSGDYAEEFGKTFAGIISPTRADFAEEGFGDETIIGRQSEGSETETPTQSEDPDMPDLSREELKAHLEANEARVEQIANEVKEEGRRSREKMDATMEKIDARLDALKSGNEAFKSDVETSIESLKGDVKESTAIAKSNRWVFGLIATIAASVVVALFLFLANDIEELESKVDQLIGQTEQVEQSPTVGPGNNQ